MGSKIQVASLSVLLTLSLTSCNFDAVSSVPVFPDTVNAGFDPANRNGSQSNGASANANSASNSSAGSASGDTSSQAAIGNSPSGADSNHPNASQADASASTGTSSNDSSASQDTAGASSGATSNDSSSSQTTSGSSGGATSNDPSTSQTTSSSSGGATSNDGSPSQNSSGGTSSSPTSDTSSPTGTAGSAEPCPNMAGLYTDGTMLFDVTQQDCALKATYQGLSHTHVLFSALSGNAGTGTIDRTAKSDGCTTRLNITTNALDLNTLEIFTNGSDAKCDLPANYTQYAKIYKVIPGAAAPVSGPMVLDYSSPIQPAVGASTGGYFVDIIGNGFVNGPGLNVFFGVNAALQVIYVSSTKLHVKVPSVYPAGNGAQPVKIVNGDPSNESYTITPGFVYVARMLPNIKSLSPTYGANDQDQVVTIYGGFWGPNTSVLVNGVPAQTVSYNTSGGISDSEFKFVMPAKAGFKGEVKIQILNHNVQDGEYFYSNKITFTYFSPSQVAADPETCSQVADSTQSCIGLAADGSSKTEYAQRDKNGVSTDNACFMKQRLQHAILYKGGDLANYQFQCQ